MKIILLRHGKPSFELSGCVRADEVGQISHQYDLSGICDLPSEQIKQQASACNAVVCSPLPRSITSAEALGLGAVCRSDVLFREAEMPHFKTGSLVLPVMVWIALLRGLSVFGFSRNGESLSMVRQRADAAAVVLIGLAQCHESVVLVGHGMINHFIAKALLVCGWSEASKSGHGYWGCGAYHGVA